MRQVWALKNCRIPKVRLDTRPLSTDADTSLRLLKLVHSFRNRGHYAASLDPLANPESHLNPFDHFRDVSWLPSNPDDFPDVVKLLKSFPDLNLKPYGLDGISSDEKIHFPGQIKGLLASDYWIIKDLVSFLRKTYCSSVGIEFSHIENDTQRKWIKNQVEGFFGPNGWDISSKNDKIQMYRILCECYFTNQFIYKRFPYAKVFGIEGCESFILALWSLSRASSSSGVESIYIGMAHRGRMNVLHNFLQKPLETICDMYNECEISYLGDMKYHLGTRAEISVIGFDQVERKLRLSLSANPSHLEAVNPVVLGNVKANQLFVEDADQSRVIPLLIHGDASFCGQGIVPEVMELSNLPDYSVGGTIHIVINNQIGFTTVPRLARTSYHCTNAGKGVGALILHVNGDCPESVLATCKLALEWRQKFKRDVIIDIVCYRRFGHNSKDDPSSTQPLTYSVIAKHPSLLEKYRSQLISSNAISSSEADAISNDIEAKYHVPNFRPSTSSQLEWLAANWQGKALGSLLSSRPYNQTGVPRNVLTYLGRKLTQVPPHFVLHKDVQRLLKSREASLASGTGISFAFAEALAFACLMSKFTPDRNHLTSLNDSASKLGFQNLDTSLKEHPTVHIRLSGQDVIRGTFNQRHAAIYCQLTNQSFWQLKNLGVEQASITVANSSLSESAILGFEYGYSLQHELALTIWEAQFGDFANNAQVIIDNFIASGESKWNYQSSLVISLPHGYDGQGPEHSNARIERFLQLVNDDPDSIPGHSESTRQEIDSGFGVISEMGSNEIAIRLALTKALLKIAPNVSTDRIDLAIAELISESSPYNTSSVMTKDAWYKFMSSWLLNNSEREQNMVVVQPSTPAQYFHVLRRQVHRPYAKPLVLFTSKWLLHHRPCSSSIDDFLEGTFFQRVIVDNGRGDNLKELNSKLESDPDRIRKIIFCSGQIYYKLHHLRNTVGAQNIILVRIEQISPFPYDLIGPIVEKYSSSELLWVQEEPKNMGAWSHIKPRMETLLRTLNIDKNISYVGRKPASSSATGSNKIHTEEQNNILKSAFL